MSNEKKSWIEAIVSIKKWFTTKISAFPLYAQHKFRNFKLQLKKTTLGPKKWFKKKVAVFWLQAYRTQNKLSTLKYQYGKFVFPTTLMLFLICTGIFLSFTFQNELNNYYSTEQTIESLRALILNVGSALIGASVIVTSLVLFAMQVNIERMPHGLFRRLSEDWRLLGTFALTFLLAISVAILSILINQTRVIFVILASFLAVVFILVLFLYAYRRALFLINPLQQVGILITDTCGELRNWGKKAQRISPILEQERSTDTEPLSLLSTHDSARVVFFNMNKQWDNGAKRGLRHAMSFARRYAEQGDYEVSKSALDAIIIVNATYIEAKGKTFYAYTPFFDNTLLAHDSFLNDTLEHLRQSAQVAISRRDEQQTKQILQAMADLHQIYLGIDYCGPHITKSHANMAAGYLTTAVQDVVPHDMVDVLMQGQRLMGQCAQQILIQGNPNDITMLSEKISLIACTGPMKENYRPVTMEGMKQLADLTFNLLHSKNHDISYAVNELRQDLGLVVKMFLNVPDTILSSFHSYFLSPYYSSTSTQSLRARLMTLGNTIIEAKPNDVGAKSVIRNIEQWANGMYQMEKDLLLIAIKTKSKFTFDMIYWITGVTEILLAISNAPACDDFFKQKIRDHARRLIMTLSWIPDDDDTVTFVENFMITEEFFKAAMNAQNRDCADIGKEIGNMLLSWAFKCGKHERGWRVLEKALCGLAAFALIGENEQVSEFKTAVITKLSEKFAPTQKIRDCVSKMILERIEDTQQAHWPSSIDLAIKQADRPKLTSLLKEIASLLSP